MQTLTEQLYEAFVASGLSVAELLTQSGLDIERSSLSRKLRGELRMNTDEAEALARELKIVLVFPRAPPRAARRRVAA